MTADTAAAVMPHDHAHVLGTLRTRPRPTTSRRRIEAARAAHREWSSWPFEDRAAVFLKAAELLTTRWRDTLNAATMLGQSKTVVPGRDRRGVRDRSTSGASTSHFAQELLDEQPIERPHDVEPARVPRARRLRLRGDAVQLHVDRRQPADRAGADGQHRRLEAGVERDVLGALPHGAARGGRPAARRHQPRGRRRRDDLERRCSSHRDLAGVHFTGSTEVFNDMWKTIGASMASLPLVPAHRRRDRRQGLHRRAPVGRSSRRWRPRSCAAAFEFQGQKCSAASRIYVPRSLWPDVRDRVVAMMDDIAMGDIQDFRNFMGAVIDQRAFDRITGYID